MGLRPGKTKGPWVGVNPTPPPPDLDEKVKATAADTTTEYLDDKIVTGTGISKAVIDKGGGNLAVEISAPGSTTDELVKVTVADTTAEFLSDKIVAGSDIAVTVIDKGAGNLAVQIDNTAPVAPDELVKATAADTTPNYLSSKMAAGSGISLAVLNPGANEQVQISTSGSTDEKVKITAADSTPGYLGAKLTPLGQEYTTLNPAGAEVLENEALPTFRDPFYVSAPFWTDTEMIRSGDFQVDIVNHRINGTAENNQKDWYRIGVEGDFDHVFKLDIQGASSGGLCIDGNSLETTLKLFGGNIVATMTGESNVSIAYGGTVVWMRARRTDRTLRYYYRSGDTDSWTLHSTFTKDMGFDAKCSLDSMNTGRVLYAWLHDSQMSQRIRASQDKVIPLTEGATINIDLRQGNVFEVVLGGNRTLAAPTANQEPRGTKFIIRVRQDATGSRTLTWNAAYRFPAGTSPTLTTTAAKTDYFGFVYNERDSKYDCIAQEFNL